MRGYRKILTCLLLVVVLPLLAWHAATAQDAEESFVWGITANLGDRYLGLFSPAQVPEIYLLAGEEHILSGKSTYVYYWPIDHEYKPDWSRLNQDISGTLEILDARGQPYQTIKQEWYLLKSDANDPQSVTKLLVGNEALAAYQDYWSRREAYLNEVKQYDQDLKTYLDQLKQAPSAKLTPPPTPFPFAEVLQEPKQGFILSLSPGRYTARMRDEAGNVIPGSQRTIFSVAPQRQGTGLVIIPEDRWTKAEKSFETSNPIYFTNSGTTLYLQPIRIMEYNEREFARLTNPQEKVSSPNRSQWVQGQPISGLNLELWNSNRLEQRSELEAFTVQQSPGYALGYRIVPFDPKQSSSPDIKAYKLPLAPTTPRYTLRLVDDQGKIIPGSERIVQRASLQITGWMLLLVCAPLAIGATIKMKQSLRRKQNAKEIEKRMIG